MASTHRIDLVVFLILFPWKDGDAKEIDALQILASPTVLVQVMLLWEDPSNRSVRGRCLFTMPHPEVPKLEDVAGLFDCDLQIFATVEVRDIVREHSCQAISETMVGVSWDKGIVSPIRKSVVKTV